jgi:hypothetical protein
MVVRKDAGDLRTSYFKAALMLCGVWAVAFIFVRFIFTPVINSSGAFAYFRSFLALIFVAGSMALSSFQLYRNYNHRSKGVGYFMLPASHLEKFLSMLFHCVVVTPVVALATFALFDICLYPLYPWEGTTLWVAHPVISTFNTQPAGYTVGVILAVQSVFFFSNVWFQRAKIQKTALLIGLSLAFVIGWMQLMHLVFPVSAAGAPGSGEASAALSLLLPVWQAVRPFLFFLILPTGLWVMSYIKMKGQAI